MQMEGHVGPSSTGDGVGVSIRMGRQGDQLASDLHGRFYEQNFRGNLFVGGVTLTAINNATFTSATTGATATPLLGIWNPANSQTNAVVLQANLTATMTALQATGGGPYVWMATYTTANISTATSFINAKTLVAGVGNAKNVSGVALTGMTGTLAFIKGSYLGGGSASNAAFLATAVGMQAQLAGFREDVDGSIIVPPGGILALMATTTPVAHSVVSGIIFEEVPVVL